MRSSGRCASRRAGVAVALLAVASPLVAQQRVVGPAPSRVVVAPSVAGVPGPLAAATRESMRRASATRLVVGGAIGAAVGLIACNVISEVIEEAEASSHCTTNGNLAFAAGGFVVGVILAALTD